MKENQYKCSMCNQIFDKPEKMDWNPEKEAEELWGVKDAANDPSMDVVCDDCWKGIDPRKSENTGDYMEALLQLNSEKKNND